MENHEDGTSFVHTSAGEISTSVNLEPFANDELCTFTYYYD
jgi:hypothetical protein